MDAALASAPIKDAEEARKSDSKAMDESVSTTSLGGSMTSSSMMKKEEGKVLREGCESTGGMGAVAVREGRVRSKAPLNHPKMQLNLLRIVLEVKPFGYGRVKPGWEEVEQRFDVLMAKELGTDAVKLCGWAMGTHCRDVFTKVMNLWLSKGKDASSFCGDTEASEWNSLLQKLSAYTKSRGSGGETLNLKP